jgi:hypothetical protein
MIYNRWIEPMFGNQRDTVRWPVGTKLSNPATFARLDDACEHLIVPARTRCSLKRTR